MTVPKIENMNDETNSNTISVYEMLNQWKTEIENIEKTEGIEGTKHTTDLVHEIWDPKWTWFRPPWWWIFRWAYNIKTTVFHNVYPAKIWMDIPEKSDE